MAARHTHYPHIHGYRARIPDYQYQYDCPRNVVEDPFGDDFQDFGFEARDGGRVRVRGTRFPRIEGMRGNSGNRGRSPGSAGGSDDEIIKLSKISFPKAAKDLYTTLGRVDVVYRAFLDDFNEDIRMLNYVSEDKMEGLWRDKIRGKVRQTAEDQDQSDQDTPLARLKSIQKDLVLEQALDQLLECNLQNIKSQGGSTSKTRSRVEASKRMKEKIRTADAQIRGILMSFRSGKQSCIDLLWEIKKLQILVDPEDEDNKESVYKVSYGSEEESDGSGDSRWAGA